MKILSVCAFSVALLILEPVTGVGRGRPFYRSGGDDDDEGEDDSSLEDEEEQTKPAEEKEELVKQLKAKLTAQQQLSPHTYNNQQYGQDPWYFYKWPGFASAESILGLYTPQLHPGSLATTTGGLGEEKTQKKVEEQQDEEEDDEEEDDDGDGETDNYDDHQPHYPPTSSLGPTVGKEILGFGLPYSRSDLDDIKSYHQYQRHSHMLPYYYHQYQNDEEDEPPIVWVRSYGPATPRHDTL